MNTTSTTLPTLLPADIAEIQENRIRIGLHTDEGRCYCPECVDHRNRKDQTSKFHRRMLARGFANGGNEGFIDFLLPYRKGESIASDLSFDELYRASSPIAPTNSLLQRIHRARFEKRFGHSDHSDRFHTYYQWNAPSNLDAVQPRRVEILDVEIKPNAAGKEARYFILDVGGESVVTPAEVKLIDGLAVVGDSGSPTKYSSAPSPSTGRLDRYDRHVTSPGRLNRYIRQTTSLPVLEIPKDKVVDPFKGRALTACVGTENRTEVRKADSYSQYALNERFDLPHPRSPGLCAPKPDAATYAGFCTCPRQPQKPDGHLANIFVYPDGSSRYECAHDVRTFRNYFMVYKQPTAYVIKPIAEWTAAKPNKNWKRDWRCAEANGKVAVHSIYEKVQKVSNDASEDLGVDIHVDNESGDEIGIATPAEAHGLDWIENDMTRESKGSAFDIDAEKLLELAKKFYGVDLRYVTHEDVLRDPHFSNFARAYVIRVRYADGHKISDSEKRQLSREVNYMTQMIEGRCPSGTCPSDRCANPDLTLSERAATHAANLPHTREKMFNRVGQWYCVVDGFIKWLPDPSEFDGETEHDRVEAAFDELVRQDLLVVARQARKDGRNPKEAAQRRQAAFDAVAEISKVVSEEFEKATVESTSSDQ